jgi:hypothetical protein
VQTRLPVARFQNGRSRIAVALKPFTRHLENDISLTTRIGAVKDIPWPSLREQYVMHHNLTSADHCFGSSQFTQPSTTKARRVQCSRYCINIGSMVSNHLRAKIWLYSA